MNYKTINMSCENIKPLNKEVECKVNSTLEKLKLKELQFELFIGKVACEIGFEKTIELLKQCKNELS